LKQRAEEASLSIWKPQSVCQTQQKQQPDSKQ
jgi:hypothetical protein